MLTSRQKWIFASATKFIVGHLKDYVDACHKETLTWSESFLKGTDLT